MNATSGTAGVPCLPDRWRPLAQLPTGHRTQVWVAEDRQLGERVVLKLFPPCADPMVRARALTEVRLGLLLQHPHLVQLYEVLEWQRLPAALPESCPRWLRQFVERLLARDPRDRWPTAVEALSVFDAQRTA